MTGRIFRNIGIGRPFLFWGISLLFGLSGGTRQDGTILLHLLAVLNDQYYFIFAVIPVFLLLCTCIMEDDSSLVLIRYHTYSRYFFVKWRALAVFSTALWLGQIVAILISGWGLPLGMDWVETAGGSWREVFELLRQYFASPWSAAFCCAAYLLLGYWLTSLAALWLGHFCHHALAVKLLMGLYVLTVLLFKLPVLTRPPFSVLTGLNHWFLLLHNLTEPWRLSLTAELTLLLAAGMMWSICRKWRWRLCLTGGARKGLAAYYLHVLFTGKNLLILVGVLLLAAAWTWIRGGSPDDGTDWLIRFFAGHGTGYFDPMGLLTLLVIEVFPLWPLGLLCAQAANERSAFLTIRLKHWRDLPKAILSTALLWFLLYGGLIFLMAVLPPMFLDLPVNVWLAAAAALLKLLDVWVQFLIILAATCLTGQAAMGFTAVVVLHFLCVLPFPYLPVGLSSLLRLRLPQTEGVIPPLVAAGLLAALAVVLLGWIIGSGARRLFER